MVTGYIFTAFLIILGLAVMRFGSIHFKKFKEGKTKIKSKLSGQLSFLILLIAIIGLIVYSIIDLLFNYITDYFFHFDIFLSLSFVIALPAENV